MSDLEPQGDLTGFVCPRCGGALRRDGAGESAAFRCRIRHRVEAAGLWIEHCAARNRAILAAARALAENAALARTLSRWAHERGDEALAARLEGEASEEDRCIEQVRAMVVGLGERESEDGGGRGRAGPPGRRPAG